MLWDDARDAALRERMPKMSFSVIAADLSRLFGCYITRNAAIGRAARLGLSGTKPRREARPPAPRPERRAPAVDFRKRATVAQARGHRPQTELPVLPEAEVDTLVAPIEQRRSILELTDATCRWPHGDVGAADFYFCGGMVAKDKPYCPHHCRLAYQPLGQRKERAA
jgi:GcrA cell cycle regulator